MAAQNIANGLVDVAQWEDVAKLGDGVLILDVRDPAEVANGAIPGSLNIPLPQLRARLSELPRDRELLVHCQSGQRSYNAARLLSQRGFKVRNLAGSYKTWKTATSG
jgi:rhodanese-related sulfurtransferase